MVEYFEKTQVEDVIIERVNLGKVTLIESKVLWERLQNDIIKGHKKIIADLSQCKTIDSALIGVIIHTHNILAKSKGNLKLVLPIKQSVELFSLFSIDEIINIYDFLEDAVDSFNNEPEFKKIAVA
jgi:anti-anti-sigma regulatory factor